MSIRLNTLIAALALAAVAGACAPDTADESAPSTQPEMTSSELAAQTALYELFVRDFSDAGTFQGVIDGLDRIQATGVEVIWLMPIFPVGEAERKGTFGSPYAVRDYTDVNPLFGTKDDFRDLVAAVHERGMKLILDWVPNHTAWDNGWIEDHPEYYARNEAGEMTVPRDLDGNLTDWTDVVELDYSNVGLRRAMTDALKYWIEEFDVDGYRFDVAGHIPAEFYRAAIPELRSVREEPILMLAEWGDPWLLQVGFDLIYPWSSYGRLKEVWRGRSATWWVGEEIAELEQFPEGGYKMRMTTNHDETAWDAPPVELFGGSDGARAAFVAMALLPGPPLLYNGQEVESHQELPLFEKMAVEWDQPDADGTRAFYRSVIDLARTHEDLVGGGVELVVTDQEEDVIAYRRGDVVVLVNVRSDPLNVTVDGIDLTGARDLLGGDTPASSTLFLDGYGWAVLQL
jgi:glycosidase